MVFRKILAQTTLNFTDNLHLFRTETWDLKAWSSLKSSRRIRLGLAQSWNSKLLDQLKQTPSSRSCHHRFASAHAYIHIQITANANTRLLNAVYSRLQHYFLFKCFELHVLRKWSKSQQSHILHYLNKWFKVLFHLLLWLLSSSQLLCIPSPASAVENVWLHMLSL